MKFVPYDRKKIRTEYKFGKLQEKLREFAESGLDCAKVEDSHYKSAKTCQTTLLQSLKSLGLNNSIRVTVCDGEVFLLRKNYEE